MSRIACKYGSSTVADHNKFLKIRKIIQANPKRTVIVPSAPGKRHSGEAKITDLLYLCHEMAQKKVALDGTFTALQDRYLEIESGLGLKAGMAAALEELRHQIEPGASKDCVASRSEYLCGLLMAAFLEGEFVDPAQTVFFDKTGRIDPKTYDVLGKRMSDPQRIYVLPGFYGVDTKGQIKTFSRGGSDISGAIAA